jgi:TolA protein
VNSGNPEVNSKERKLNESGRQEYNKLMERYLGKEAGTSDQDAGAQRLGGTGTGGDQERPAEYFTYVERMKAEIDRRWIWHLRHEGLRAQIRMRIAEDGVIEFAEIVKGSGNLEFDRSVMRAIQAADPLPAPPPSVYRYFKDDIIVIFDPNE